MAMPLTTSFPLAVVSFGLAVGSWFADGDGQLVMAVAAIVLGVTVLARHLYDAVRAAQRVIRDVHLDLDTAEDGEGSS